MPAPFLTTTCTLSGIEVGDDAQLLDLRLAFVDAGAGVGPGVDVGLAEARLHRAADDAVDVGDRAVGGDRADVDLVGRDRIRDHAADRIIGAAGAAGSDAEEALLRQRRRAGKAKSAQAGTERQHVAAGDDASHEFVLPRFLFVNLHSKAIAVHRFRTLRRVDARGRTWFDDIMSQHAPIDLGAMISGIQRWVETESPTHDKAAVNRMMDVVQSDVADLPVKIERVPGTNGFADNSSVSARSRAAELTSPAWSLVI